MNAKIKLQTLEKNLKIWAPLLTITYFGLTSWSFLQQRQLIQYQFRYLFIMLAVASIFGLIRIFKLFRSNLALTTLVLIPTALLFCLRECFLKSICSQFQHTTNAGDIDDRLAGRDSVLEITRQAAITSQPAKRALHNPAMRQNFKALGLI